MQILDCQTSFLDNIYSSCKHVLLFTGEPHEGQVIVNLYHCYWHYISLPATDKLTRLWLGIVLSSSWNPEAKSL